MAGSSWDGDSTYIKGEDGTDDGTKIGSVGDEIKTRISLNEAGVSTSLSISSSVEVKVGGSTLTNRQTLSVQPVDGTIYLSYSSPATAANAFMQVFRRQYVEVERGAMIPVYAVAKSGTVETLIGEVS